MSTVKKCFVRCLTAAACALVLAGNASAQPSDPAEGRYVEAVAQSAFGNVTSQSYGIEAGFTVAPDIQIVGEFGRVRDAATDAIGANAAVIAGGLSQSQSNVSFTVAEPVTFYMAAAKYIFPVAGKLKPYALAGFGLSTVHHDATYRIGGTDVTDDLEQYGVVLGEDLSGSTTDFSAVFGAGAQYPIGRHFILDLQFRFNHIFADDEISIGRAGVGFGVRF